MRDQRLKKQKVLYQWFFRELSRLLLGFDDFNLRFSPGREGLWWG